MTAQHSSADNIAASRVAPEFLQALVRQLQQSDQDAQALLNETGLAEVFASGGSVSAQQYSQACLAAFERMNDESGGMLRDAQTTPGTTRLLLMSMLSLPRLEPALQRAIEFNACCRLAPGTKLNNSLLEGPDEQLVALTYTMVGADDVQHEAALCGLAMWLRLCSWLIGQSIDIHSAGCVARTSQRAGRLRHFLSCPVSFGADDNALVFSRRHLHAPILRDIAALRAFLPLAPYHAVIDPAQEAHSISRRIRDILGDDFSRPLPSFEQLTRHLNMSARTLRRRLEREGTSYQRIKDNARRDAAVALLATTEFTVTEVSERLGFSDPSAFHRSFKKWTGEAPGQFREPVVGSVPD